MKRERLEYRFHIDAYTPETLPMARLAEYLADLARFLGNPEAVHLIDIEEGSTVLVQIIDWEAEPKVTERIRGVKTGTAPKDAMDAYRELDRKLGKDNASAELRADQQKLIEFPGRKQMPAVYGPFAQQGTLDGVPIVVGGRSDPVPVHLEDGDVVHNCLASRQVAKKIADHLFTSVIRAQGTGRWHRDEEGNWIMDSFRIADFDILSNKPLKEVVADLRAIPGSEWKTFDDPLSELDRLRHGEK